MVRSVGERRAEERIVRCVPVVFTDTFVSNGGPSPEEHEAVTLDVSLSGLSFRTSKPVEHMMALRISSDFLWDGPRMGVVKWCSVIYPGIHRVGVSII